MIAHRALIVGLYFVPSLLLLAFAVAISEARDRRARRRRPPARALSGHYPISNVSRPGGAGSLGRGGYVPPVVVAPADPTHAERLARAHEQVREGRWSA